MSDLVSTRARLRRLVLVAGWLLIALCLGWEWWWAPVLPALARNRPRAYQWATLVVLLYLCEGMVRATSEGSPVRELAVAELILAAIVYVGAIRWLRAGRGDHGGDRSRSGKNGS